MFFRNVAANKVFSNFKLIRILRKGSSDNIKPGIEKL